MEIKAYEFDEFRVDLADCTLLQEGSPVSLTPKAFDTLRLLVENSGRLLDKDVMMQRLWPDAHVEEANLANNISLLRKALGASGVRIQTVPRRGYRFAGDVRAIGEGDAGDATVVETKRDWKPIAIAAALTVAGTIGGLVAGRVMSRREPVSFEQVTFRRGIIHGARYASDGETIVYAAVHEDRPSELFVTRADQRESKALSVPAEAMLAVSRRGELAILTKATWMAWVPRGTLARMPITGGAPREVLEEVQDADFAPDGDALAVIRWDGNAVRIEYPIGRLLYKAEAPAWVSGLRVSPDGSEVAILLHHERFDDSGRLVVLDRAGKTTRTSRVFTSVTGLTWHGDEVWIAASATDLNNSLYAIDRGGRDRVLAGTAGRLVLCDLNAKGRALAMLEEDRMGVIVRAAGETAERELSWLDGSWFRDLSPDGRTILFDEEGTAGGSTARVYVRKVDGSPAINLGAGNAVALSPDGRWALARQRFTNPPRLVLIPTGAGQTRVIATGKIEPTERAAFLPASRSLVFVGNEPDRPRRTFLYELDRSVVRPLTPEGMTGFLPTADGAFIAVRRRGEAPALFPIRGGDPVPLQGVTRNDFIVRFSADGKSVFAVSTETMSIERIDFASGQREVAWTFGAARPAGCVYTTPASVSANGAAYGYTYASASSSLFVVDGLR